MNKRSVDQLISFLRDNFHCYTCGEGFHEDDLKIIGMGLHSLTCEYFCPGCHHDYSAEIPEFTIPQGIVTNDLTAGELDLAREEISGDEVLEVRAFAKTVSEHNLSKIWPKAYLAVRAVPKPIA